MAVKRKGARRAELLAGLALAALVGGCGGETDVLRLGADDDGRLVAVEPGAVIEVRLDSNPSTGFAWRLVERPDAGVLRLVSSRFEPPDEDEGSRVGRGGTEVWRFEAAEPGTTSLRLAYVRSWEPADQDGRFGLRVRVE